MKNIAILLFFIWCCGACDRGLNECRREEKTPEILPDYKNVVIPCNIAPLNFSVEGAEKCVARFFTGKQALGMVKGNGTIDIPIEKWRKMLDVAKGGVLRVHVFARLANQPEWVEYRPFEMRVMEDSIDPYIAYRLIAPGYELWGNMGIYQRNLETFEEKPVIENRLLNKGCVNCHSFHNYSPDKFMFHVRKEGGGTIIVEDGKIEKVNMETPQTSGPGVYPMWHPSGKYIAFSLNSTRQAFHAYQQKKIEVYDLESDLILYDVPNRKVIVDKRFNEKKNWETFPAWSPDGKWLYFCQAEAKNMPFDYKDLKYGIFRVAFDPQTGTLGDSVEIVVDPAVNGKSADFPRISPDGRYLLYTQADCGTFPIWHKEADLKMIDLQTGTGVDVNAWNSDDVESYHSWSSGGRWVLFSSRRGDGQYTRLYIGYFDRSGRAYKPFLLPQREPGFYKDFLKSYNIPEFVSGEIKTGGYELSRRIEGSKALPVSVK